MWSSSTRQINYGLPPEMGMVGFRDLFVVAPASSFHHNQHPDPILSDHHQIHNSNVGIEDGDNLNNRSRSGGIQLWHNQQSQLGNYLKKPMVLGHNNSANFLNSSSSGGGVGIGGSSSTSSASTCQDCGNQAKKDCTHQRCRSCCKNRGFDCPTHVKSTWVPAARRRERQLSAAANAGSSGSTSAVKKPRLITSQTTTNSHTSTSNTTPRSFDTSSSHQDASFKEGLPGHVRAPAVFKCVRVTAIDDGEDEYAYQAVVKIGGHVFKGLLYDQGVEEREGFPNISELHLGGSSLDPSDVYPSSGGGLLGGVIQATLANSET